MPEERSTSFLKYQSPKKCLCAADLMMSDEFSVAYCVAAKEYPVAALTNRQEIEAKFWHNENVGLLSQFASLPFLTCTLAW